MIEILVEELCTVGGGRKVHIKRGEYYTLCNLGETKTFFAPGLISMTDKADELCKSCLREYRIRDSLL